MKTEFKLWWKWYMAKWVPMSNDDFNQERAEAAWKEAFMRGYELGYRAAHESGKDKEPC